MADTPRPPIDLAKRRLAGQIGAAICLNSPGEASKLAEAIEALIDAKLAAIFTKVPPNG